MLTENKVYLQLKSNITKDPGQVLYLKDIANLSCHPDIKKRLEKLVVLPKGEMSFIVMDAIDIVEIIRLAMPSLLVFSIGEMKTLIEVNSEKDKSGKVLWTYIKVAITCILLFLGSGLAIMYFHEDVNMHEVHRNILLAITGENKADSYWLSIPYSIGIGMGIALFFGAFPNKRQKETPDPLKISMYQYNQDINSYLESEEERKQESK